MKHFIFGTGGSARETAEIFLDNKAYDEFGGFVDLTNAVEMYRGKQLMERPVISVDQFLEVRNGCLTVAVGGSQLRAKIVSELPSSIRYANIIHHSAKISPSAHIGTGTVICSGCSVMVDVVLGKHTQLNIGSSVSHDTKTGDFFTTGPGARINGTCTIGNQVYIGSAASVKNNITITHQVIIGMAAAVVSDCKLPGTYVGIPAKLLKR